MRILVTGGAGFIGSHLCRKLLSKGNFIICVDNFITGHEDNIKDLLSQPKFKLINHDISQPLYVDDGLDWVMHFASPASPKDYLEHPIKTLKVGTLGTYNCLGIAKKQNLRFFLASTSEIYGDPLVHPQPEEYFGNVNSIGPRSCYDEAKRAAEALTFAYQRQHNIDIRVARIFNTYGPFMRMDDGRVVSNLIYQALTNQDLTIYGDGSQTRSFCYVDDLIEGIVKYMEIDYPGPLNLGNPEELAVIKLAKKILELTKSKSKIKFLSLLQDDPKRRQPDIGKARKLLSWRPKISLTEGLEKTIPWFAQRIKDKADD
ncbi:MAG: SDR family oxidoreductase [Candidatus Omnitrophota bacterium]|jgi:dTDP-glucose 4,6-dehydratase